jgi:hypothetical protein
MEDESVGNGILGRKTFWSRFFAVRSTSVGLPPERKKGKKSTEPFLCAKPLTKKCNKFAGYAG